MSTIVRAKIVAPPVPKRLPGTLLDAATVTEGLGMLDPLGLYPSLNCMVTDAEAVFPCPVVFADAPVLNAAVAGPVGPQVAPGTYFFAVTTVTPKGESEGSNEVSIVVPNTTGNGVQSVTLSWADVAGAVGYNVYIGSTTGNVYLTDGATTNTYVWDGTPPVPVAGTEPPTTNSAGIVQVKDFGDIPWVDGVRFTAYGGVQCRSLGTDGDVLAQAEQAFNNKESNAVERALMLQSFNGATDLTPAAGAVRPMLGVGLLEGDAAANYAGAPTIHVPRTIGTLLIDELVVQGNRFFTKQGSKVASGGGYQSNVGPSGAPAPVGEMWLYASGEVSVVRGEAVSRQDIDYRDNETYVLVERMYIASVDCYTSAVRVKVE